MGIYIRGMEMPKNCGECKFFAWKRGVGQHCAVDDRITFHATIDGMDVAYERNGNCPLVPVPPHGRLIDADALADVFRGFIAMYDSCPFQQLAPTDKARRDELQAALAEVINAPTIIPAEEGE